MSARTHATVGSSVSFRESSRKELSCRSRTLALTLAIVAAVAGHSTAKAQPNDDARRTQEAARQAEAARQEEIRRRTQEAARAAQAARDRAEALRLAERQAAARAVVQQVWPDEQFEQWVFQQDRNAAGARQRFDKLLVRQIEEIDRACQLTEAQKRKLQLLGRGDIKRFFDAYETVKHRFKLLNNDVQRLQEIQPEVSPLRIILQSGLFPGDTLISKALRNTLTADQFAHYDAMMRERHAFRHRAQIELAITMFEQGVPLRDAQRRELIALLTKETKPSRWSSQYDIYVIMDQIGNLSEAKIKPLLSETQWRIVDRQIAQYKAVVPNLRQNGLLPNDDDADDARPEPPKK